LKLETTEAPVMCSDLSGFWDMVYMQVKELLAYFSYFEKIKGGLWGYLAVFVSACVFPQ
jgi:hypothetical protein